MAKKDEQPIAGPTNGIQEKIDAACKEVVLGEEVANLKKQLEAQLRQAKDNLAMAQQQTILWDTRIKQITGSIAACSTLLEKRQKPKSLILTDDHNKKGKE